MTRVPDRLAAELDELVAAGFVASRSDAVRTALQRFVDRCRRDQVARRIVDGYRGVPQSEHEVGWTDDATAVMIREEPW